ncbi:hypothetical protein OUZ56_024295 [Daphnia magna]|uniref:CCHC-type domain-containing protein n=1 Tax=Daphnia magna TaxID=35525 RepID=A0ABR0B0K7_9CRUS|nr:hypothetical protein OUZ56_024295 [Daphnia magna]
MSKRPKQQTVPFQTITRASASTAQATAGNIPIQASSPTRPSRILARLSPVTIATNDDLIQALTAFTQAAETIEHNSSRSTMICCRHYRLNGLRTPRYGICIPKFEGRVDEDVWGFIDHIDTVAISEDWNRLMQDRIQQPNESGMEYALDKFRVCRLSPTTLTERDAISFLINGLARWEHVAAMAAAAPIDIPAFITRIQQLEQLGVSARPEMAPNPQVDTQPPLQPDLTAAFKSFSDKLVTELASKLESLTVSRSVGRGRGGPPGAARPPIECWICHNTGHKARYCPTRPENTSAGR